MPTLSRDNLGQRRSSRLGIRIGSSLGFPKYTGPWEDVLSFSLGFRYLPWNMMEFRVSDAKIHSFHKHALSVELGQARCRDAVNAEGIRPEQ